MKYKLLTALVCICSSQAFSQINKGQWLMGGGALYSFNETNYGQTYSSQHQVQTTPNFGYFLFNKVAVGVNVNFSYLKNNDPITGVGGTGLLSSVGGTAGPFVRAYFLPGTSRINFMLHGSYQFGVIKNTVAYRYLTFNPYGNYASTSYNESSSISRAHNFMIAGGPVFVLNPHVTMELLVAYNKQKIESSTIQTNSFFTGIGFQIHLGKGKTKA